MDIWTIAAAAGAGYIAKHFKGFTRGGNNNNNNNSNSSSLNSSQIEPQASPLIEHPQEKNRPFRRLMQRKHICENVSTGGELPPYSPLTEEPASTSGCGGYDDFNVFSTSGFSPAFLSNGNIEIGSHSDILLQPTNIQLQPGSPSSTKNTSNIRNNFTSKWMNQLYVKPLNSLESCLMAQLYKENNYEKEEYMLDQVPLLSMPTVRPLLVTDGSRIISRASGDYLSAWAQNGENEIKRGSFSEENRNVCGVPPLPHFQSLEIPTKMKIKTRREKNGRTSTAGKMANRKDFNPQCGSSNGAILFCLGVTVGIISSLWANNQEVDKLNELLKQTENLVQDLQEELEMKDSLTVKELHMENHESHDDICNTEEPRAVNLELILNESTECNSREMHDNMTKDESLSKIEAELEAELERLELSMNSSSLKHKLSDLVELDPDFAPDIAQGELRADVLGTQTGMQPYADRDGSGSSTTHSANYAVSPRELSLRLHALLQSRLEERVIELETALYNSNKKVELMMKSEDSKPWIQLSNGDSPSPYVQESSDKEEEISFDEPVVINLSGEALDAYNEAYDVFANMDEDDLEENEECLSDDSLSNGDGLRMIVDKKGEAENESSDEDDNDEMEKLLIKQILEQKTRGSPAVQRVLSFLMDKDEDEDF